MGTFGSYTGAEKIRPEQVREFGDAMSKILYLGGMMHVRNACLYDTEIQLLDPVRITEGKDEDFIYNYFEDDYHENAGYIYGTQHLYSNKIGWAEFEDVITAGHCLYEFYDKGPGLVTINGEVVDGTECVAWFNHIFGKSFTMEHRFRLWDNVESYIRDDHCYEPSLRDVRDIIPRFMMYYAGGTELADVLYVFKGTDELTKDVVEEGSYSQDVLACKCAIEKLISNLGEKKAYNSLKDFIKLDRESRSRSDDKSMAEVAELSMFMPARVFVYLICELEELDFWDEWIRVIAGAYYKDEQMKKYASDELTLYRDEHRREPVKPIGTSESLQQKGGFTHHDTPEELASEGDYLLNDSDRLYWWDGTDEVKIDEECEAWLQDISGRYKEVLDTIPEEAESLETAKSMMRLLDEVHKRYIRVYAFNDMFYEFISAGKRKEYRAAIELLRVLHEDENNKRYADILKSAAMRGEWCIMSKNIKCCKGRMNMKRYMSLLANRTLREKYLGF